MRRVAGSAATLAAVLAAWGLATWASHGFTLEPTGPSVPSSQAPRVYVPTPSPRASSGPSVPSQCHIRDGDLPDPTCTPGATLSEVNDDNVDSTICRPGRPSWSRAHRPPFSVTNKIKLKVMKMYGLADANPADYELDHLVPLSWGGDPTSVKNLWPEPGMHNDKDKIEDTGFHAICAHEIPLSQAQRQIAEDWHKLTF